MPARVPRSPDFAVSKPRIFVWMSCRFNVAKALVLFANRVSSSDLAVDGAVHPHVSGEGRRLVNEAADRADIDLV